jgi:hypothetical protein
MHMTFLGVGVDFNSALVEGAASGALLVLPTALLHFFTCAVLRRDSGCVAPLSDGCSLLLLLVGVAFVARCPSIRLSARGFAALIHPFTVQSPFCLVHAAITHVRGANYYAVSVRCLLLILL